MRFVLALFTALALTSCVQDRASLSGRAKAKAQPRIPGPPLVGQPLEVSLDPSYAVSQANPVNIGGFLDGSAPSRTRAYFTSLQGPQGEPVTYWRYGRCCPFQARNGMSGQSLLDTFGVSYEGRSTPIVVYVNIYDIGPVKAPMGLTLR